MLVVHHSKHAMSVSGLCLCKKLHITSVLVTDSKLTSVKRCDEWKEEKHKQENLYQYTICEFAEKNKIIDPENNKKTLFIKSKSF